MNRSTKAGGPFIKQSLRDFLTGSLLLQAAVHAFMQGRGGMWAVLEGLYHGYVVEGTLPLLQFFLRQLPEDASFHGVPELAVELFYPSLLDKSFLHSLSVSFDLLVVVLQLRGGNEEGVGCSPLAPLLIKLESFQDHMECLILFVRDSTCPELTLFTVFT